MLRSEHVIVHYDFGNGRLIPDRLRRGRDDAYIEAADECIRVYRESIGRERQGLHREVEEVLARQMGCPPKRIGAFCKLLDDLGEFTEARGVASKLRRKVFGFAAGLHPIVSQREGIFENTLEEARRSVCEQLGMSWEEIEAGLYADVVELQTLRTFNQDIDSIELLSAYNVRQTQGALYRASRVVVDATEDYKTILRHAKLAGLMHEILRLRRGQDRGYRFVFDGPASNLRETSRYGIRYASFIPKLLACRGWTLRADILGPGKRKFRMDLSPRDRLRSTLDPPDEFDSELEREVWDAWLANPVAGWEFERESELLHVGQMLLTPDFVLRELASGQTVYVEVVGFWTKEYLEEKERRLATFRETGTGKWLLLYPKNASAKMLKALDGVGLPMLELTKKCGPEQWVEYVTKKS